MDIDAARKVAEEILAQYPTLAGWRVGFSTKARRRLGLCRYRRKEVQLSTAFVEINDESEVRRTRPRLEGEVHRDRGEAGTAQPDGEIAAGRVRRRLPRLPVELLTPPAGDPPLQLPALRPGHGDAHVRPPVGGAGMTAVGQILRAARLARGLSLRDVASRLGYRDVDKGIRRLILTEATGLITEHLLARLLVALGLDPDEFRAAVEDAGRADEPIIVEEPQS